MAVILGASNADRNSQATAQRTNRSSTHRLSHAFPLEVPPDVAAGRVVVVVGGLVVGGGLVVVVGAVGPPFVAAGAVVVVVGELVGGVVGPPVAGTGVGAGDRGTVEGADPPGCSLATVIPMKAVAAPATMIAVLVRRVIRAWTLARAPGVEPSRPCLTRGRAIVRRVPRHGRSDGPRGPRHDSAYGPVRSTRINLEVEPK
jgi:hypothetical protein